MERTKYSRTFHLPWSNCHSDDKFAKDLSKFHGKEVVVTEKMDGENTSVYSDGYVHARSIDTNRHPSRDWVKALAAGICYDIPSSYRLCGENLFAWHSIFYTELPSYFLVFGIYDGKHCLSWKETEDVTEMLGLPTVPVIWRGVWDENAIKNQWMGQGEYPTFSSNVDPADRQPEFSKDFESCEAEGYVVRLADSFLKEDFADCCVKYVRENHVQTDAFWLQRPVLRNLLKD